MWNELLFQPVMMGLCKFQGPYGADVAFRCPDELAGDRSKSSDFDLLADEAFGKEGGRYEPLLLQLTSPWRAAEHINKTVDLLLEKGVDSVVGGAEIVYLLEEVNTLPEDLSLDGFFLSDLDGM